MTTCRHCGHENRDDVWTCAACGEPMGKQEGSPSDYGTAMPAGYGGTPATTSVPAASGGNPKTLWIVIAAAAAAVLAIVCVWFFFLRTTSGDEFLGTWAAAQGDSVGTISQQLRFERDGGDIVLFFNDEQGESIGPFKTEIAGKKIETRLEYIGDDDKAKASALILQGLLTAMIDDFKLVFYFEGDKLFVKVEGKPKEGVNTGGAWDEPTELKKVE